MRGKLCLLFFFVIGLAAVAPPVRAADVRTGEQVVIAADEIIDDDLIVSAQFIEINGTITGDLVATGGMVVVNGTVEGSALLAAQSLEVRGRVGGTVYGAGYSLLLDEGAAIHRNVLFAGFSVVTRPDSQVERDVYVVGNQMLHDGVIGGSLNVTTNALQINGAVGGDVVGEVAPGGTSAMPFMWPNMPADIEMLPSGIVIGQTAQIGGQMLAQETPPTPAEPARGFLGMPMWLNDVLGRLIGVLLIGALVVALMPRFLPPLSDALRRQPLPSLGWGVLIYVLVFPLAILVGLALVVLLTLLFAVVTLNMLTFGVLTLTSSALAFGIFAFLFFVYVIAWLIAGHLIGRLLLGRNSPEPASRGWQFVYVLVGVLLLHVLRAVPVLSIILAFIVGSLALGAVFVYWLERRRAVKGVMLEPKAV